MPLGKKSPLQRFDDLTAEEARLVQGSLSHRRLIAEAQGAVKEAGEQRVTAESDFLRDKGDRRDAAARAQAEAHAALQAAELARDASRAALDSCRIERGKLVRSNRGPVFLADAERCEEKVRKIAAKVLADLADLQAATNEVAKSVDRLRPRSREDGSLQDGRVRLAIDLGGIRAAIERVAETGTAWPKDISRDGIPISRHDQLVNMGVLTPDDPAGPSARPVADVVEVITG